jgi:hypothetical protein
VAGDVADTGGAGVGGQEFSAYLVEAEGIDVSLG